MSIGLENTLRDEGLGSRWKKSDAPGFKVVKRSYKLYSNSCNYQISNESYSTELIGEFDKHSDFNTFIGICGGGTQVLYLLSKLSKNNQLESCSIVDIATEQLKNLEELIDIYDKSKDNCAYAKNIAKKIGVTDAVEKTHLCSLYDKYQLSTNFVKPVPNYNVEIGLYESDIIDFLKKSDGPGKCFIYLSNALFSYINNMRAIGLLSNVLCSPKFKNGTVVFCTVAYGLDGVFLTKNNQKFDVKEFGDNFSAIKRRYLFEGLGSKIGSYTQIPQKKVLHQPLSSLYPYL